MLTLADTNDWKIGTEQTIEGTRKIMQEWWVGPKSPGILALEHELNKDCVDVFIAEYPSAAQNGWTVKSVPDAYGLKWYQNADGNEGPVVNMTLAVDTASDLNLSAPLQSPSSSAAGASASVNASAPSASGAANASGTGGARASGSGSVSAAKAGSASSLAIPGVASLLLAALAVLAL